MGKFFDVPYTALARKRENKISPFKCVYSRIRLLAIALLASFFSARSKGIGIHV